MALRHEHGTLIGGPLKKAVVFEWDWSKNGGGYGENRDFFTVHWEVQERDPNSIRLHVESPVYQNDSFLNELKQEVIDAILASNIGQVVQQNGYEFQRGRKLSSEAVQKYKSTEPCRVILTDNQRQPTTEQDMAMVNAAIGPHIDQIIQRFSARLNRYFAV